MMMRPILFAGGSLLALAVGAASPSGQAPQKTTNSGVYTAAQAERGRKVFEATCTACHDTARFTGEQFVDPWEGKPLKEVFDIASGTMPEDNPGSLAQQEYGDIIAYFLQLNGFATGDTELQGNAAAMANVKMEKLAVAPPGVGALEMTSVNAGVYTPEQADRGQLLYRNKCASCHPPVRFTDEDLFHQVYAGKPLWELFDAISETMPEDDPGGMQPEEYADVIAYILRLNRYPTGAADIPTSREGLSAILLERPTPR
jgi:mono/diheme cytochrome c family protein